MRRIFSIAMILALVFNVLAAEQGAFASAWTASWIVSIVYQNVGVASTSISLKLYAEDPATPITINAGSLAVYASASLYIGSISDTVLPNGFHGNVVINAEQPLATTIVQFSNDQYFDQYFKVRMLSTGFQAGDGSYKYLIPTTLKNMYGRNTAFSIQNMDDAPVNAAVQFVKVWDGTPPTPVPIPTKVWNIPANSTKYIEMDNVSETGLSDASFDGSAIVSVPLGSRIVATAGEMYTNLNVASGYEGVPATHTGHTIYMASALCHSYGLDTAYAIQNTSLTDSALVTITYRTQTGAIQSSDAGITIQPGRKISRSSCLTNPSGFTGSAIINSVIVPVDTPPVGASLAVVGKADCYAGAGSCGSPSNYEFVHTAFLGEANGASKLALPYVRWADSASYTSTLNLGGKQRCSIAIQNLQNSFSSVDVLYYGKAGGSPLKTHTITISPLSKGNSDPNAALALQDHDLINTGMVSWSFGYYTNGSVGGSVIIKASSANPNDKYIAIARCNHSDYGEDYNAVHIP